MPSSSPYDVVILGAGVIGLSIALELENEGWKPAIVARDLPDDTFSTGFASPWAGCNWHSFEMDPKSDQLRWDKATFRRLAQVAKDRPDLCERIPFVDVYQTRVPKETIPWHDITGDFREVEATAEEPLPAGLPHGHKFTSYVLDAPKYTQYLGECVRAKGIPIIRRRLTSLDEAYNIAEVGRVGLVINATGLGAKGLIGVEDQNVYPARGQTVLVKAPNVKRCIMRADQFLSNMTFTAGATNDTVPPPPPPYIIPRPGPDGHVVLGGTYGRHDWSTVPDLTAAEQILKGCYELDPALANGGNSWRDIEVVSVNVGPRPSRQGGARVELENRQIGEKTKAGAPPIAPAEQGRNVSVIHAYGFAGVGYIASLGVAEDVARLAKQHRSDLSLGSSNRRHLAKL